MVGGWRDGSGNAGARFLPVVVVLAALVVLAGLLSVRAGGIATDAGRGAAWVQ